MAVTTAWLISERQQWQAVRNDPQREKAAVDDIAERLPRHAAPRIGDQDRPGRPELEGRAWRPDVDHRAVTRTVLQAVQRGCDHEAHELLVASTFTPGAAAEITTAWDFDPGPRHWLVADWLPLGRVTLLAGEGGRGKSRLALQLADGLAAGDGRWLPGAPPVVFNLNGHGGVVARPAVIATWEDDAAEIRRRLADNPALHGANSCERPTAEVLRLRLGGRLHVCDMATAGPLWAPADRGHVATAGELSAAGRWIRAYAEVQQAQLLIIDPLAAAYACSENDRGLVRAFMASWDAWGRRNSCSVLIIGHPPKSGAVYAGSTDWHAAARAVWSLAEVDGATQLSCLKSSYGPRPPRLRLERWQWWTAAPWDHGDGGPASWQAPPP